MWYEKTATAREQGQLQLVGLIQEQHPERCALFMQWQEMDFPILVDSLNVLDVAAVPSFALYDEHGQLMQERIRAEDFDLDMLTAIPAPSAAVPPFEIPNLQALEQQAHTESNAALWRRYGEALFNYSDERQLAVEAFKQAVSIDINDGIAWFRLGAALQWRSESEYAQDEDAQAARIAWGNARELNPNQYIWRRRLQQYGAVRNKPYSLYGWVEEARNTIRDRGDVALPLRVPLTASELATLEEQQAQHDTPVDDPDPNDRIFRDQQQLINHRIICTPQTLAPGQSVHVQFLLSIDVEKKAHWNNEVEDLCVYVRASDDWTVSPSYISIPNPDTDTSIELRSLECELIVPAHIDDGDVSIPCFALAYLCEDLDGSCLYLRHDMQINLRINKQTLDLG